MEKTDANAKKIDKTNVEDIIGLSHLQEGLLYHYITEPGSGQYVEQLALQLHGDMNAQTLRQAWASVAAGNEMLRIVFRWEKLDKPVGIVLKQLDIPLQVHDLSALSGTEQDAALEQAAEADFAQGIDIAVHPFRLTLCPLGRGRSVLILTYHHLLFDGWSSGIILKEFLSAYEQLSLNRDWRQPAKPKYKQFIGLLQSQDKESQRRFWNGLLGDFETKTLLPYDKRKKEGAAEAQNFCLTLDEETSARIDRFAREHQATLAAFIYGAWALLLQRYNDTDDIVFGTTVSGRPTDMPGVERMAGLFINTLPLRVRTEEGWTSADMLRQIGAALRDRESFEQTSLVDIKSWSGIKGQESLFDSIVVLENYPLDQAVLGAEGDLRIAGHTIRESTNFPLALTISTLGPLQLQFQYNSELFGADTIRRLAGHLVRLIGGMAAHPDLPLSRIEMLEEDERARLHALTDEVEHGNYAHQSIHEWFEEQAAADPGKIALVFRQEKMTYGELNEHANRIAWFLKERGIGENDAVGVMAGRSFEMIAAIYGILKAGAAYVPVDPDYPAERIEYLLRHSRTKLLLVDIQPEEGIAVPAGTELCAISDIMRRTSLPAHNPGGSYSPDRLIYVLYTSGSTGNPKGVMVRQNAFVNLLNWFCDSYRIGPSDNVLLIAPSSFDLAQKNLYCTLIQGGRLTLFDPGLYDYNRMSDVILREKVTLINCAPSAFYPLIDFNESTDFIRLSSLRTVFLGGEPINVNKLEPWYRSQRFRAEIANTYGPTECTDIAAHHSINFDEAAAGQAVPIGRPIYNTRLYVLDRHRNLVPEGMIGELYIGGAGLAAGYYDAPELTAERFVDNPFAAGELLYRTGDLVNWLPGGLLNYVGRTDSQLKIRGMRLELAEIEAVLLSHDSVKEAVVKDWQNQNGSTYLCAYLVGIEEGQTADIKAFAAGLLPDYMVPASFVALEKMPLSPNGKINKKALPEPQFQSSGERRDARDSSETELLLIGIWQQLLGRENVGLHDPFFDIGGNSILLIGLHGRLDKLQPGKIAVTELFSHPTIAQLAKLLDERAQADAAAGSSVQPDSVPLPDNYFVIPESAAASYTFNAWLPDTARKRLLAIGEMENAALSDLLLGMFVYLLTEFSERQRADLHIVNERNEPTAFAVQLDAFEQFSDLFQYIRDNKLAGQPLPMDSADGIKRGRGAASGVLPLYRDFAGSDETAAGAFAPIFDLIWEVGEYDGMIRIICTLNSGRLRKELAEELADGYTELIDMLIQQYEKVGAGHD